MITIINWKKIIFTSENTRIMSIALRTLGFVSLTAMLLVLNGCKNKDPSVLKVFVRSSNNELMPNARVVIIADIYSNPPTPEYVDTVLTNSSGFALFEMDEFFDGLEKGEETGYFDILATKNLSEGTGSIRCRAHITSVQTVKLQP